MVTIKKIVENKKQFLDLLLLADEQENMIDRYLSSGDLFVLYDGDLKSICVVMQINSKTCELKNIATYERYQRKGFGNVDKKTPEFAISLFKEYRNQGIGTRMMKKMITYLQKCGYEQASLSVQKENYAVRLYKKVGFEIIGENNKDYLMLLKLN